MAGKAVFQLEMGRAFMAHGALWDDIFTPGRMLAVAIETGHRCLVFATVSGNYCRFTLVALRTVGHVQWN